MSTAAPSLNKTRRTAHEVARHYVLDGVRAAFTDAAEVIGPREVARLLARLAGQVAIESGASAVEARAEFTGGIQTALDAPAGQRVIRS